MLCLIRLRLQRMRRSVGQIILRLMHEQVPDRGRHGEPHLCATAKAHVAAGRRHHLDGTGRVVQTPRLGTGSGEHHGPLGLRATGLEPSGPPHPHHRAGPIDHHAHAAERPDLRRAEGHHPEMQPRG